MNDNNDEFKPGKLEADFDQAITAAENLAKMFGEFRKMLIIQGLSTESAETLTEIYASHFFRIGNA